MRGRRPLAMRHCGCGTFGEFSCRCGARSGCGTERSESRKNGKPDLCRVRLPVVGDGISCQNETPMRMPKLLRLFSE